MQQNDHLSFIYAPKIESQEEIKDDWYEQLNYVTPKVPQHDTLLIMGDLYSEVGTATGGMAEEAPVAVQRGLLTFVLPADKK